MIGKTLDMVHFIIVIRCIHHGDNQPWRWFCKRQGKHHSRLKTGPGQLVCDHCG